MTFFLLSDTAIGYGLLMGIVILAAIIYTIIRLRKQVRKRKIEEDQKTKEDL